MTTAVATQAPKTFKDLILSDGYKRQIEQALPRGFTAERLTRVVLTAMNKTPKLLDCSKESLWEAVLHCASLGLFPDALGRAYLVPYGKVCQLIIGYKGLIDLAYRSDRIGMIQIKAVYEGDKFYYDFGLCPRLEHVPCSTPGALTHVYSVVHIKGAGMPSFDVMRRDEVEKVRSRSRAANNGPWVTDYDAMAMKTVFRRHAKVLPMSAELAQAMEVDGDSNDLSLKDAEVVTPARLAEDFGEKKPEEAPTVDTTAQVQSANLDLRAQLNALLVDAGKQGVTSKALTAAMTKVAGSKTVSQMTDAEAQAAIDSIKMEIRCVVEGVGQ